jgi:hypothetical protein
MAHREDHHPLSPLAEALEWGVVRGAAYFFAWLLGINLPRLVEWLLLGDIDGRPGVYTDRPAAGVIAFSHMVHPLGVVLLVSHLILFAVFVRFELRYRWILWPLAAGLFWRLFVGHR